MKRMSAIVVSTALAAALAAGFAIPAGVWSQTPDHLQDVEKRLAEKRAAAEAHRMQMEGLKNPDRLSVEMRRHFQMTEEMLALMLERRKLMEAHGTKSGAPVPGQPTAPSQPGMGRGMGGMHGGMMQKEMGSMGGGMQGGMSGGGMMEKEKGGMSGMPGMGGGVNPPAAPGPGAGPRPAGDMDEMMRRIAEHSAHMETIQDQAVLGQEMLRHQKMLDQMLQLMQ